MFFIFFAEFELSMFYNIMKISEKLNTGTCWKSAFKLPTLQISAQIAFIFTMGKGENNWFSKN